MPSAPESETEKTIAALDETRFADGETPVADLRLRLQQDMQDHAAVYRTQDSLAEGVVRPKARTSQVSCFPQLAWLGLAWCDSFRFASLCFSLVQPSNFDGVRFLVGDELYGRDLPSIHEPLASVPVPQTKVDAVVKDFDDVKVTDRCAIDIVLLERRLGVRAEVYSGSSGSYRWISLAPCLKFVGIPAGIRRS